MLAHKEAIPCKCLAVITNGNDFKLFSLIDYANGLRISDFFQAQPTYGRGAAATRCHTIRQASSETRPYKSKITKWLTADGPAARVQTEDRFTISFPAW